MKTLKDKIYIDDTNDNAFTYEDVKEHLNNFYNDYWKLSKIGDKNKKHITCDELDYLIDKHFNLIHIETLQQLPNQDKMPKYHKYSEESQGWVCGIVEPNKEIKYEKMEIIEDELGYIKEWK